LKASSRRTICRPRRPRCGRAKFRVGVQVGGQDFGRYGPQRGLGRVHRLGGLGDTLIRRGQVGVFLLDGAPFADVEPELTAWIADQAWLTGEGPKAIFSGAVAWLRGRQALLPAGVTTLERMVAAGREAADQRLWQQLTSPLTPPTSGALLRLLDVPDAGKQRVNELDRLRKGLFRTSSKGMVAALNRVADLAAVGAGSLDVSAVPPRRLLGLAAHGIAGKTTLLRRMSREHRRAVLVATVLALSARATDDALELFDLVMTTELLSKAERESKDEKLRRYPRVSRNAGKFAAAVTVLLEMSEVKPDISLEMVWDLIENAVTKSELRAAVAVIDELVPADDAELNGQRLEELAGRLATVRPFLPLMMRTIEFGATADGAPVLKAMKTLADLLTTKTKLPATWLDARKVDQTHDGPGRMLLSLHGLVKGQCRLERGRRAGEDGVAGDGAGVVIEYDGQPRACAGPGGVDNLNVQLGVVALPLLVRAAGGAPVDQLEPVPVRGVAFERDCAQSGIDGGNDRPDRRVARGGNAAVERDGPDPPVDERDGRRRAAEREAFDRAHDFGRERMAPTIRAWPAA